MNEVSGAAYPSVFVASCSSVTITAFQPGMVCSFFIEQIVLFDIRAAMLLAEKRKSSVKPTETPTADSAVTATTGAAPVVPAEPLSELEAEVIGLFVQLSRALGQPRSIGEIYGLLFISARPLAMDELIARLVLSKGSASQGLKFLRNMGAVKMVYVPGDRRVHYEAVAELRNLATRFLRDHIVPHLDNGLDRLEHIAEMIKQLPPAERARAGARITMLQSWEKKSRRFLPMVVKILGG